MNEWVPTVLSVLLHIQSVESTGVGEGGEDLNGEMASGREQTWGLQVPDPCSWDETHTIPRPGTWGHVSTVSKVTPPPQALHLGWHDPWIGHQFLLVGSLR